jgi:hypothetical protein
MSRLQLALHLVACAFIALNLVLLDAAPLLLVLVVAIPPVVIRSRTVAGYLEIVLGVLAILEGLLGFLVALYFISGGVCLTGAGVLILRSRQAHRVRSPS